MKRQSLSMVAATMALWGGTAFAQGFGGAPVSVGPVGGVAGATAAAVQPVLANLGGVAAEPDGMTPRTKTDVSPTDSSTLEKLPAEKPGLIYARLDQLLGEKDGRGLDPIRLIGEMAPDGSVKWTEVRAYIPNKKMRHAALKDALKTLEAVNKISAGKADALTATGAVNDMVRTARRLLSDGDNKDASANGGRGSGTDANGGAGGRGGSNGAGGANGLGTTSSANAMRTSSTGNGTGGLTSGNGNGSLNNGNGTGGLTSGTGTGGLNNGDGTGGLTSGTGIGSDSSGTGTGGFGDGTGTGGIGGGTGVGGNTGSNTTPNGNTVPGGSQTPITGGGTNPGGTGTTTPQPNGNPTDPTTTPGGTATEPTRSVTTTACSDRIDVPGRLVYSQQKQEVFVNGVSQGISSCTDAVDRYPIQWDPSVCTDDVDLSASLAYPKAQPFYVTTAGARKTAGNCQRWDGKSFSIYDTAESCSPSIDLAGGKVIVNKRKAYKNLAGTEVTAKACAATSQYVPIQWTAAGCDVRHDVGGGTTYQQMTRFYLLDGSTRPIGGCEDHGATYPHYRTENGCEPAVNNAGKVVTLFQRTVVNLPEGKITVQDCTPSSTAGIVATTEGCEGQYIHVPAANVSYGTVRYRWSHNGSWEYTEGCTTNSAATYQHQDDPNSPWFHDDTVQQSWQQIIRYVDTPSGRIVISKREGTRVSDYNLVRQDLIPAAGSVWYSGCTKYQGTQHQNTYIRTDQTTVTLPGDAGAPVVTQDGCSSLPPIVENIGDVEEVKTWGINGNVGCSFNIERFQKQRSAERRQNGAGEIFQDPWVYTTLLIEVLHPSPTQDCGTGGN
ncbi:hypothetical protein ABMY26_07455 (plasmid) [Azospirillum sp. HJ39]|uniref:hypothetical protein n=1 Tax=Azospirillum sp. HJ39 TaxID=3159496 RepID=UPI00355930F7